MGAPPSPATGRFTFDIASGAWEWDREVFRIHGRAVAGAEAGEARPTLDDVLAAATDTDRERVREALAAMAATSRPFTCAYRLDGVDNVQRMVVLVGERALCDPDEVTQIEGYFIDLTEDVAAVAAETAHDAVQASAEHRALIEQAKGALMLAYGFDADAAFAMLRWWSRNRNMKLRDLAAELMSASEEGTVSEQDVRIRVDRVLHDITQGP